MTVPEWWDCAYEPQGGTCQVDLPTSVSAVIVRRLSRPPIGVVVGTESDSVLSCPLEAPLGGLWASPDLCLTFALFLSPPAEATGRRVLQPPGSRKAQTARRGRAQVAGARGAGSVQASAAEGLRAPGPAPCGSHSSPPTAAHRLVPAGAGPLPRLPVHRQVGCLHRGGGGGLRSSRSG